MKRNTPFSTLRRPLCTALGILAWLAPVLSPARAATTPALLDDYSDAKRNRNGIERLLVNDQAAGSKSSASQSYADGVLSMRGDLVPGRGVPAFISLISFPSAEGKPGDLSGHQGVRLRVKVTKGILCVQVASAEITNFDYHTGAPIAGGRGEFQEVRVPFKNLKRGWSEQTALNPKSITSINLVFFVTVSHSFRMEVFFLLAGFFSHLALQGHEVGEFLKSRAMRILVPFAVGWFLLRPLIVSGWILGAASLRGDVQIGAGLMGGFQSLATLPAGIFTGSHLWFLYYLALVTAIAVTVRAAITATGDWREPLSRRADAAVEWLATSPFCVVLLALPTAATL